LLFRHCSSGIALYDTVRREWGGLKVVVFTNVSDRRVAERFGNEDRRRCLFVRKPEILPFQFAELVEGFVRSGDGFDSMN
jgi:hypothetical protein